MRSFSIYLFIFFLAFPPDILGDGSAKRLTFPKGKSTVSYRGKLPLSSNYDAYFFPARKGRFLTVKLISADRDAYFAIYETKQLGPGEDTIVANDRRSLEWTGMTILVVCGPVV